MEFLSSVSTLRVAGLPSTAQEYHRRLLRPPANTLMTSQSHLCNKPNSSSLNTKNAHLPLFSPHPVLTLKPTECFHQTAPCIGYADALLDMAWCNEDVEIVEKDVWWFSRLLRSGILKGFLEDYGVGLETKGKVLKEVGFHRHVVRLVRMMVEKGKVGLVGEVLEEFKRICDEMKGTQIVLVSSAKMGEEELLGIAENVHKMSGASKVKLKVYPIPSFVI